MCVGSAGSTTNCPAEGYRPLASTAAEQKRTPEAAAVPSKRSFIAGSVAHLLPGLIFVLGATFGGASRCRTRAVLRRAYSLGHGVRRAPRLLRSRPLADRG